MWVQSLAWEDPLEEDMTTYSSILAWRTPWIEEPGGLWSVGLQSWTRLKSLGMHAHKAQFQGLRSGSEAVSLSTTCCSSGIEW